MPIMRSRKASPGLTLMRTMIQSDRTTVPPVTVLKSLPAARITGADSPVTALSLTDAAPTTTSPSPGMRSPTSTKTRSPLRRLLEGTDVAGAPNSATRTFFATVSLRALLSDAACALLRPSAIASAKLANSSVAHNHSVVARMKPAGASPLPTTAWIHSIVVRMLPM